LAVVVELAGPAETGLEYLEVLAEVAVEPAVVLDFAVRLQRPVVAAAAAADGPAVS
jgi:hypothetical protein